MALLVHVVQGGLHWHYCGVNPGYVAADWTCSVSSGSI